MNERLYLGVEIGGTKTQVVLGNADTNIIDRRRYKVDLQEGGEGIRKRLAEALDHFQHKHRISAVGIGFGGPVDWRTGKIACSHHVKGWNDFNLVSWMAELARVPVRIDNDANTAALAEAVKGAGRKANPVFYVTLGSGVGGGLVVDRQIYHGASPGEAELGHVRLDKSGTIVEKRCSGWAVDERIRTAVAADGGSLLARLVGKTRGGEAAHLARAISERDPVAEKILDETSEDLAFALSHMVHLVHPEAIIIGGGLSLLGEPLRAAVQRHLPRFLMAAFAPGPEVAIAKLQEDVVPIGALLLAKTAVA